MRNLLLTGTGYVVIDDLRRDFTLRISGDCMTYYSFSVVLSAFSIEISDGDRDLSASKSGDCEVSLV